MGRAKTTVVANTARRVIVFRNEKTPEVDQTFKGVSSKGVEYKVNVFENLQDNIKEPWEIDHLEIYTSQGPAGYLKIGNIPKHKADSYFPTILDYMVKQQGKYSRLKVLLGKDNWEKEDYAKALEITKRWDSREKAETLEQLSLPEIKKLWKTRKAFLEEDGKSRFEVLKADLDRPYVDFIRIYNESDDHILEKGKSVKQQNSDFREQGLGLELYKVGAEYLSERGLKLYASTTQTKAAQACWEKMKQLGWVTEEIKNGKPRLCLNSNAWRD